MPRLSIVIPCLGAAEQFDGTLVSVLQQRPADCEVVLVHAQPYDDPYDLGDEVRFLHAPDCDSLVGLLNAALPHLRGDVLHTLACGLEVDEGWTEAALRHFADPEVGAVSPLVLTDDTQVAAAGVAYGSGGRRCVVGAGHTFSYKAASRWNVAGPSLLAGFYCREALVALGGFDERMGDTHADLDIALALDEVGLKVAFEPSSQPRLVASYDESLRHGFSAGRQAEQFYRRHGARSAALARWVVRPLVVAGDVAGRLPGFGAIGCLLGRSMAWLEVSPVAEHQERIAQAVAQLEGGDAATISLDAERTRREQPVPTSLRKAA